MSLTLKELKSIEYETILNRREKEKCLEAFIAFDKNGSKMIEKEELQKVLEGKYFLLFSFLYIIQINFRIRNETY